MVDTVFLHVLNMSFMASFVILWVVIARRLLKKSPKIFSYALWSVVLFRLVCPFSFESGFSLLPVKANPIPQDIVYQQIPRIDTGIAFINDALNSALPAATPYASVNPLQVYVAIAVFFWLAGIAALLIYSAISLFDLRYKLIGAVRLRDNIYLADHIQSPFIMGVVRPKIYLPSTLSQHEETTVILHEQTHIRRFDPVVKLAAYAVLLLHWFNPLVWMAFTLCIRDMEMSCDESVLKNAPSNIRSDYSKSLFNLATGRKITPRTPLAFGENDPKGRIKNVLSYKKPTFWVMAVSLIAVAAIGIGLLANPQAPINTLYTPVQTPQQEAALRERYELADDSHIVQTKIRVDDSIKSSRYYVELYQKGKLIGTFVENTGNMILRDGTITTAFSMNRGDDQRWNTLQWTSSFMESGFLGGGYATSPSIPFPEGFSPGSVAVSVIANAKNHTPVPITPDEPVIIAAIGFALERSHLRSYECEYLMEHPEAIAQYECVYLVKMEFSREAYPS